MPVLTIWLLVMGKLRETIHTYFGVVGLVQPSLSVKVQGSCYSPHPTIPWPTQIRSVFQSIAICFTEEVTGANAQHSKQGSRIPAVL